MLLGFGFITQTKNRPVTQMTPNLIMAYYSKLRKKIVYIIFSALALILGGFVFCGSTFGFIPVVSNKAWQIISMIMITISCIMMFLSITWGGPAAIKLYTVMASVDFDKYLAEQMMDIEKKLSIIALKLNRTPYKRIKQYQRVAASIELTRQIYEEIKDMDTFDEQLEVLMENTHIYGFEIRDITKYAKDL